MTLRAPGRPLRTLSRPPQRRSSMAKWMSERLKYELAQDLGVDDVVRREGWGGVSARNCGRLVELAIRRAEEALTDGGRGERR